MSGTDFDRWINDASDAEDFALAARACLDAVQDSVVRMTKSPWPPSALAPVLPEPGADVHGGEMRLWFASEENLILVLESIRLAELTGP
jgi:hypothetical protein